MEANIDISLQISQLNKTGNKKRHKGSSMAMVSSDKKTKYSVFLPSTKIEAIVKYYLDKGIPLKTAYVRIHSIMIYLCVEKYLKEIKSIKICADFKPTVLTRELYDLFPELKSYRIKWVGGRGNKSSADKYANKVRRYPEFANMKLSLNKIKSMETPRKE